MNFKAMNQRIIIQHKRILRLQNNNYKTFHKKLKSLQMNWIDKQKQFFTFIAILKKGFDQKGRVKKVKEGYSKEI